MRGQRLVGFVTATVALLLTTSCSGTTSGKPETRSPTQLPTHQSSPSDPKNDNIPQVSNPLDVAPLKADPCNALSAQQVEKLGLKRGSTESISAGPVCDYEYKKTFENSVNVMITKEFSEGIAEVYKRKGGLAYFEETTVSGYPAVYAGQYKDRDEGRCMLHVGLTNSFVPAIFAQLNTGYDSKHPCEVAKMTAEAMIKHLKGGA